MTSTKQKMSINYPSKAKRNSSLVTIDKYKHFSFLNYKVKAWKALEKAKVIALAV